MRQSNPNRRRSLLQAALDLSPTRGYAGTTTKAIAEQAGVSEAMLLRHFSTKDVVLCAVVDEMSPRPLFTPPSLRHLTVHEALDMFLMSKTESEPMGARVTPSVVPEWRERP